MPQRNIRVGVRLRPAGGVPAWRVAGAAVEECPRGDAYAPQQRAPRRFRFDAVFDVSAENAAVYDTLAKAIVADAIKGTSGALIACGQTASGKTHTMQGTPQSPGLIPRAVRDVFRSCEKCRVSYLECYNERVRDLLGDAEDLRVVEGGPVGCREVCVESVDGVFAAVTRGERRRSVGATRYNDRSSRSHAILRLVMNDATLTFVDLAGSEATASTEGHCINRSLHALALVIAKLADGHGYVPYRDSKLTRLLRPALAGRVALVCNVAPDCVEETTNTLHFARRATRVVQAPLARASPLLERYRAQMDALQTQLRAPPEPLPPEPPGPAARDGINEAIADLERLIAKAPTAPVTATPVVAHDRRGRSLPPARTLFFDPIDDDDASSAGSPERCPWSPCAPEGLRVASPLTPQTPLAAPSPDTTALREVQRKLRDALVRSAAAPDENLAAAAQVLERLEKSKAANKTLRAELARVSTILASRERELVKMKGLASPEDEVF